MSFFDDDFELPDAPDAPEAPDVPDTPEAPSPTDAQTPNAPEAPGQYTPEQNDALGKVTIDGDPASNVYKPDNSAPAPIVQVQQDIVDLKDNSDLDTIKGSGPAATDSTKPAPPESNTQTLAKQTIGTENMSRAPAVPSPYMPGAGGSGSGGGTGSVPGGGGIINGAMDWAKANPQLAAALATGAAGALGGAGKAALDKKTMESKAQLENANAESLFAYKQEQSRNFSAAGALAQPNLMQPNVGIINGGLKRPGGANVFGANGRLQR